MVRLRALGPADHAALWDWLHLALWDPPPAPPRPRAVLAEPAVRIYAERWGGPHDRGFAAVADGTDAGACWMRVLPEGVGLASVDATTPQLGIALLPGFRGHGIGGALLRATLAEAWRNGYARVALTVHPRNPAVRLYERCGFRHAGDRRGYRLMVAPAP